MKRILFFALLLAVAFNSSAAGLIIIHETDFWVVGSGPRPGPGILPRPPRPVWASLEVRSVRADVKIKDQVATTVVDEEFYNPNSRQLEGTFIFPVPRGAQINKFTMEIDGKPVEAELLAADKARGIYEDIVRKLKDPALLEYSGRDLFKVRIFPIEANSTKKISLSYSQVLKSDTGLVGYTLPLNTEKYSAAPVKNVSVKVELDGKRALKSIYSPSHKIEVVRHGETKATVGFEATNLKPDTDFQLFFAPEEGEFGLNLLTSKEPGEDGYFLLLASPGAGSKEKKVIPKDVVFVVDTSGSMAGAKMSQAKKALQFCVENLNDRDRFDIIRFSTEVEPLYEELAEATKAKREQAQKFVEDLKALGGTDIDGALKKAMALGAARANGGDRQFVVIFLTDGRPTVGTTDEEKIIANATHDHKENTRIFCFGIGTDVNTHLLDLITEETKAYSQYVLPDEDIEVKVSSFYTKIKEPVLANVKITFPENLRVTKMYPSPLPDLFNGEQLVIAGRYTGSAQGKVVIEGNVGGEAKRFNYEAQFPDRANDNEFIPRLWATRRVGYLLDEIRLRGEDKELKDETTELARKYGIVTPYTAYLIVEDEKQRGVAQNLQTLPALSRDKDAQEAAYRFNRDVARARTGDASVAGARSYRQLKTADRAEDLSDINTEALRAAPAAASTVVVPSGTAFGGGGMGGGGGGGVGGRGGARRGPNRNAVTLDDAATTATAGRELAQSSRFLGGKSFVENENQWIDVDVQKATAAKHVRIQFDSPEYYELLKQQPKALAWMALGRNVQFVLTGTVYEIYE